MSCWISGLVSQLKSSLNFKLVNLEKGSQFEGKFEWGILSETRFGRSCSLRVSMLSTFSPGKALQLNEVREGNW